MNDKYKRIIFIGMLIGALSITACTRHEDKVHESWVTPPAGPVIDDTTLAGNIQSALRADPNVKNLDVKIEAHDGEVMLSGLVDNQTQIDRVIMLAWMAEGIKKVDNKMSLKSAGAAVKD
ncbi:BON domain-containing protein [Nitrosospira sp. NpAV]|uniref:BON domain-containing protein n=1 Tax=Nitrosospira sp. NpAV TaxID=58133 RepID=UPI00059FBCC5|nr:BON domain-containing protein [Nitrosospira sp. NpAV]KIO49535.1 transport-associated protein [Nitrosospira sp. NpAV]